MVSLTLDQTGGLVSLLAVPRQAQTPADASVASGPGIVDWAPLFTEAQAGMRLDPLPCRDPA